MTSARPAGAALLADEELMSRVYDDGDAPAFEQLFNRHAPTVRRFLSGVVRDTELRRDLLQVTFCSLFRARQRYRRGMEVMPWLLTIAANAARDARRRQARLTDYLACQRHASPRVTAPSSADPALRRRLVVALSALTPSQRDLVLLHKVEGWSFGEIARAAGISEAAARLRSHRSCSTLRAALSDCRAS